MTFSIQWETLKRLQSDTCSKKIKIWFKKFQYVADVKLFYYRNAFVYDLLSVVPFRFFFISNLKASKTSNYLQLLHLFKLFRLQKIFQLLEPRQFNNIIKEYYKSKLKSKLS